MSKKKRKVKNKPTGATRPRQNISSQQNARLRQAMQAQSSGNLAIAEAEYRALIVDKTRSPELYCRLAFICAQSTRRKEADDLWKKALALDPRFPEARMNLADSYQQAGNIDKAKDYYRRVISDHPGVVAAKYLLGNLLKSEGKMDEASEFYRKALAQQPDYAMAHFTYSSIHKYKDGTDTHLASMLALYQAGSLNREGKTYLSFALAKAYEDIEDFPQAFEYLKTGNDLRFDEFHYDIESDKALIQSIIQAFGKDAMSELQITADHSSRPIFIIGMPRSGTSLVEKILASHSEVYGAGELDYIFALGSGLFLGRSNNYQFKALASYSPDKFATLARTYLEKIALLDHQAKHITDKMPFNMMMIGLIKLALPNAKIIHCVRDARDTCLSIYKQNFASGNYRFAYNLRTVAQFHQQYQRLMAHWHKVMPGEIYDISYESLTQSPETEIRKLLSACQLGFQEECLSFEKSESVVKTASAYQVRQPMYTSSVMLWEHYREFIGPMLEELDKLPG